MSLRRDYTAWIRDARGLQLANDAAAVRDLEKLLQRVAERLRRDIASIPRGTLRNRYKRDILASIEAALSDFKVEYASLLNTGIRDMATIVVARETHLFEALADSGQLNRVEQARINARLASTPQKVVENLYARVHRDGLRLGQRLSKLESGARLALAETLTEGIAVGESARSLSARISPVIETAGVDNVRYRAMRIARTEINTAFREGHVASLTEPDGRMPSYARAIGWRLSPSHPRIDICDHWAGVDDYGLGAGNYPPGSLPVGHPNCLCFTVTLLTALPNEEFVNQKAYPDRVPESQLRYYQADTLPLF